MLSGYHIRETDAEDVRWAEWVGVLLAQVDTETQSGPAATIAPASSGDELSNEKLNSSGTVTSADKKQRNSPRIRRLRWVDHGVRHIGSVGYGVKKDSCNDGLRGQKMLWWGEEEVVECLEIYWRIKTSFQPSVTAGGFLRPCPPGPSAPTTAAHSTY